MNLNIPDEVKGLLSKFKSEGFGIYIVGGAVRDLLMGKIVYDWDFTTNATPDEILKVLPEGFYDNKFGTVGFVVDGFDKPFEITTYRTEYGYSDNRRPDKVVWGETLENDLKRRDFTINSLALSVHGSQITVHDFFDGQKDLKNKTLKAVGDPNERFQEDALRMLRAVRIAGELNFEIEANTFEAIKTNASLINKIAKERIKDELFKILKNENAYSGIVHLKESGLMQEILPELVKCFGVDQKSPNRHHIYDVGTHLLMSLKFCKSKDPVTKFATLIHDIGKPQTYRKSTEGFITFYNHEMVSTKIAKNIADRLRFSNAEKDKFIKLVRFHQFTVDERQTDSAIRRFIRNVGIENIEDMLNLRVADRLGGGAKETSWRLEEFKKRLIVVQKQPFSIKDLKINGKDVMEILGIPSGPKVGEVLEKIFEKVENKMLPNEREILVDFLSKNFVENDK
jgi:tRNA nucleotidyltransferase/poly(A) polymerase